jgi:hypothetical protein
MWGKRAKWKKALAGIEPNQHHQSPYIDLGNAVGRIHSPGLGKSPQNQLTERFRHRWIALMRPAIQGAMQRT